MTVPDTGHVKRDIDAGPVELPGQAADAGRICQIDLQHPRAPCLQLDHVFSLAHGGNHLVALRQIGLGQGSAQAARCAHDEYQSHSCLRL